MSKILQKNSCTFPGIIITIFATLLFLWAILQWFNLNNWPPRLSSREIQENEFRAYKNLQLISDAQKKYRELALDKGTEKTYASYFVHLWTSVDKNNDPIPINLIPKKLAFAMGPSRAINGYYFIDLQARVSTKTGEIEWLDHKNNWEIIGVPSTMNKSGKLIFLGDQSGSIYVNDLGIHPKNFIDDPLSDGWSKIESIQALKEFQNGIDFTL